RTATEGGVHGASYHDRFGHREARVPGAWSRCCRARALPKAHHSREASRFPSGASPVRRRDGSLCRCALLERKRAEAEARESERPAREVEMELAHASRVATMGQLSASIAHEINQPITAAITNANAALRWLGARPPDLEEVRQALGRIVNDGNRAGEVISRVR